MRKVIYGGACSLDGLLTDRDGAVDWLHFSKDVEQIMTSVVGGRRHHAARAARPGNGPRRQAGPDDPSVTGVKSYVFSRTLTSIPDKKAQLVTSDAGAFVRKLKAEPGKDIIVMSGGNFATSLLQAGVIDEIGLNIHPLLLGAGPPAFLDTGARIKLDLLECRQLDGGCVFVRYRVKQ